MSLTQNIPQIVTSKELAPMIAMTEPQVWRLHRQGIIPVINLGKRSHRYNVPEVMAALARLSTKTGR